MAPTVRLLSPFVPLLAVPWLLGAGCNLFETREPIEGSVQESQWQIPTSPAIIVENLERAFEGANFNDYKRALTADFVFRADESDVAQLAIDRPGEMVFEGWDRDVEAETAETIRVAAQSAAIVFTQTAPEEIEPGGRLLKYTYTLTLTPQGGPATVYEGQAWFKVRQEANGEWLIYDWEDIADSADHDSWGFLKGDSRPRSSLAIAWQEGS